MSVEDEKLYFSQHFLLVAGVQKKTCGVIVRATTVPNYGDGCQDVCVLVQHTGARALTIWPNTASHHLIDNKSVCGCTLWNVSWKPKRIYKVRWDFDAKVAYQYCVFELLCMREKKRRERMGGEKVFNTNIPKLTCTPQKCHDVFLLLLGLRDKQMGCVCLKTSMQYRLKPVTIIYMSCIVPVTSPSSVTDTTMSVYVYAHIGVSFIFKSPPSTLCSYFWKTLLRLLDKFNLQILTTFVDPKATH